MTEETLQPLQKLMGASELYLVPGYTDLRKGSNKLIELIQDGLHLDPYNNTLYLCCGKMRNKLKGFCWKGTPILIEIPLNNPVDNWPLY